MPITVIRMINEPRVMSNASSPLSIPLPSLSSVGSPVCLPAPRFHHLQSPCILHPTYPPRLVVDVVSQIGPAESPHCFDQVKLPCVFTSTHPFPTLVIEVLDQIGLSPDYVTVEIKGN